MLYLSAPTPNSIGNIFKPSEFTTHKPQVHKPTLIQNISKIKFVFIELIVVGGELLFRFFKYIFSFSHHSPSISSGLPPTFLSISASVVWFDQWVIDFGFYMGFGFGFMGCCLMGCGLLVDNGYCSGGRRGFGSGSVRWMCWCF